MPRVLLALASIAIAVFALADCVSTEESRTKGLPKILWVLLIVFVPWIGPITWLLVGKDRSGTQPTGLRREVNDYRQDRQRRRSVRPMAPDEDPEFLAKLDRENRARRRAQADATSAPTDAPSPEVPQHPTTEPDASSGEAAGAGAGEAAGAEAQSADSAEAREAAGGFTEEALEAADGRPSADDHGTADNPTGDLEGPDDDGARR